MRLSEGFEGLEYDFFQQGNIAICYLDLSLKLVWENEACKRIRTEMDFSAKSIFGERLSIEGASVLSNYKLNNRYYDIVGLNNGSQIQVTFYPLKDRFDRELAKFSNMNLTKRENEVIEQLLSRKSNNDIVQELGISQNTLRTHLKSIYRKIGKESEEKLKSLRKI